MQGAEVCINNTPNFDDPLVRLFNNGGLEEFLIVGMPAVEDGPLRDQAPGDRRGPLGHFAHVFGVNLGWREEKM